jgi:HEAT repeat protein
MIPVPDSIRAALLPFMAATASLVCVLVCLVVGLHVVREVLFRRRLRLLDLYRPIVARALQHAPAAEAIESLRRAPARHRQLVAWLILEPLRVSDGPVRERAGGLCATLGLIAQWRQALRRRRWWTRADAAHALGLAKDHTAVPALVETLDDPHAEVRAAAVEALGLIAHPAAIPALVARLSDRTHHQHVRLVEALRRLGEGAATELLEHARANAGDRATVADLLGTMGASAALPAVLEWCRDSRPDVRSASVRAVGTIGVDDRAYYHLLRALGDDVADVRAAAAWALGRSGRADAAPYLASRLQDAWVVAAESARALRQLGPAGRLALESAAGAPDGDLARQMLWEIGAVAGAGA